MEMAEPKSIGDYIEQISHELNITGTVGVQGNELELIALVRNCKFLYDRSTPEFKNVALKNETWSAIAKVFGVTVGEVLLKWRNMRDAFTKFRKHGSIPPNGKRHYLDDLMFLTPYILQRRVPRIAACEKVDDEGNVESTSKNDIFDISGNVIIENEDLEIKGEPEVITFIEHKSHRPSSSDDILLSDIEFIETVKSFPYLYEAQFSTGKYADKKNEAWREVAAKVALSVPDCMIKWRNFRDRYCREKRAKEVGQKTNYPYFEHLSFLSDHIKSRRQRTVNPSSKWNPESIFKIVTSDANSTSENIIIDSSSLFSDISLQEDEVEESEDMNTVRLNGVEFIDTSQINDSSVELNTLLKTDAMRKEAAADEDELFGQTIAAELKRIPNGRKKMKIKADIYKLLYEETD